jgi:ABC-2 type transport system ATP-binding protein
VQGLSHAFGARTVLKDVSFEVQPGEFCALLGLNGAGKTTLFALITRLYDRRAGSVAVFGHDVRTDAIAALADLGVVFQQPTLDLDLTVEQNLLYHAALHGFSPAQARPRIAEELARARLEDRKQDRVRLLSGGQRRRVELARALVHRPRLLLLDEPTAGLDIESRRFLLDHVRALCRETGLGVLWATHLIEEAADARIVVLHQGRVLAAGDAASVAHEAGATGLDDAFHRLTSRKAA